MGTIKRRIKKLELVYRSHEKIECLRIIWIRHDGTYEYKGKIYASQEEIPEVPGTALTVFLPHELPKGYMWKNGIQQ